MTDLLLGCVLAGGLATRFGADKAFARFRGERLIDRTTRRLSAQVTHVVISRNVNDTGLLLPHLPDSLYDAGPLSGVLAALKHAQKHHASHVLTVPIDVPLFPDDMASRLTDAADGETIICASSGEQTHYLCTLWPVNAITDLHRYLQAGNRKVAGFVASWPHHVVSWPAKPIDPFSNINQPNDLTHIERNG